MISSLFVFPSLLKKALPRVAKMQLAQHFPALWNMTCSSEERIVRSENARVQIPGEAQVCLNDVCGPQVYLWSLRRRPGLALDL